MISIIIPVLNEAGIIRSTLQKLQRQSNLKSFDLEIILVDGGSKDNTVNIARDLGVEVITATGGRSAQMNAGANIAGGNILLFLHVDTQLPPDFDSLVKQALDRPSVIAGAFELAIDGEEKSLRLVEILVKLRSRLFSLPYGDQAIFITKQDFIEVGGFANLPIMEDFELIQRLKRRGKIAIAPATVTTSGRRWQKLGVGQTTIINQLVIAGYYLGVSPAKLSKFYRDRGRSRGDN